MLQIRVVAVSLILSFFAFDHFGLFVVKDLASSSEAYAFALGLHNVAPAVATMAGADVMGPAMVVALTVGACLFVASFLWPAIEGAGGRLVRYGANLLGSARAPRAPAARVALIAAAAMLAVIAYRAASAATPTLVPLRAGATVVIHADQDIATYDIPHVLPGDAIGTADHRIVVTAVHGDTTIALHMQDGRTVEIPVVTGDGSPESACLDLVRGEVAAPRPCPKGQILEHTLVTLPGATFKPIEVLQLIQTGIPVTDVIQTGPLHLLQ